MKKNIWLVVFLIMFMISLVISSGPEWGWAFLPGLVAGFAAIRFIQLEDKK